MYVYIDKRGREKRKNIRLTGEFGARAAPQSSRVPAFRKIAARRLFDLSLLTAALYSRPRRARIAPIIILPRGAVVGHVAAASAADAAARHPQGPISYSIPPSSQRESSVYTHTP